MKTPIHTILFFLSLTGIFISPGIYLLVYFEINNDASAYPGGVYFHKLVVGDNTNNGVFSQTKKMVLVK
jgi:hypothetical protein